MNNQDLAECLKEKKAVVVHFSSYSSNCSGVVFPDDLNYTIKNKDNIYVSCSVLWPGHNMSPFGEVGIIFHPTVDSVQSVSNSDSGAYTASSGIDCSNGESLTKETFEKSFNVQKGGYNEWRLKGAEIGGIFVLNQDCVNVKKKIKINCPLEGEKEEIGFQSIDLQDLKNVFPDFDIFTLRDCGLVKLFCRYRSA